MVLTVTDGAVAAITGFRDPALFDAFALSATIDATTGNAAGHQQPRLSPTPTRPPIRSDSHPI